MTGRKGAFVCEKSLSVSWGADEPSWALAVNRGHLCRSGIGQTFAERADWPDWIQMQANDSSPQASPPPPRPPNLPRSINTGGASKQGSRGLLQMNSKVKQKYLKVQPNFLLALKLTKSKRAWWIEWDWHFTSELVLPQIQIRPGPEGGVFYKMPEQDSSHCQGHGNEESLRNCHRPEGTGGQDD